MRPLRRIAVVIVTLGTIAIWSAQAPAAEIVRGRIKSVEPDRFEFVMVDEGGNSRRFQLAENAILRTGDKATLEVLLTPNGSINFAALLEMILGGKTRFQPLALYFSDLRELDEVVVTYYQLDILPVALEVCVKR